ncbi:DUF3667 domain-containing protein [Undibacterium cyanobacteriorum]|uniref:DUF3667 domain-containing protein n=1 Tax=Undibacterium cyanobacteriorum TaxID=3073561 RepID=A0ABY9RL59_9BURK|nr:DUF3667 domain-containing protein [Undibacterium sp. 20NA77.5]WMW81420.1 DUF3667 domain-containing protein [Undibacterium sp. 20NA77.5]
MGMELSGAGETLTAIVVSEEINNSGGQGGSDAPAHVEHACANCSTILNGKYCHNCGQIGHIHRSLLHMVEETLHGIFHFDTKAWRTIPALILKPGVLTRNYIDGKRASYVSPLALFLFLNFFMFFVLSQVFKDSNTNFIDGKLPRDTLVKKITQLTTEIDTQLKEQANGEKEGKFDLDAMLENHKNLRELREFQEQIDELDGKPPTIEKYTAEIQALQAELAKQKTDNANLKATTNKEDEVAYQKVLFSNQRVKFTEADIEYLNKKIKNLQKRNSEKDSPDSSASATSDASTGNENAGKIDTKITDIPWLDRLTKHIEEHRELVEYKMKKNAASFAFLLMPISLPFLWLLFMFRRNVVMFDHAVFSLYSLSFMCLLTSTVVVMGHFNWGATAALLFIFGTPIHMYKQLRYTYQLGVFGTLWRTFALLLISLTALSIYAMLVLYLSAAPK